MLKKILKFIFITIGCIVVLIAVFYAFIYFNVKDRIENPYENIPAESYEIPEDSSALALGAHLSVIKGCQDCHGANLAGRVMIDDPGLGRIVSANLTNGKGGIGATYTNEDWIRALRHGVSNDYMPLLIMPSEETTHLTQNDLTALIAYCKNLPPVDNDLPVHDLNPLAYVLTYFDQLPLLSAERIDHTMRPEKDIVKQVSVAYGEYLAVSCVGCHKPNLKGGAPIIPGSPQVADISSTGNVGEWTEAEFLQTMRTGKTPEGKNLQNEFMPWQMTASYTDDELKSLYIFLQGV